MKIDALFRYRLLRLRWLVVLAVIGVLALGEVYVHFVTGNEDLLSILIYEVPFILLIGAGIWFTFAWVSREIVQREVAAYRLAALYAIDTAAQSLNLDQVLRDAVEPTAKALNVETIGIMLLEPDGEMLTLLAHRGLSEEFVEAVRHMKVGEGVTGRAAAQKLPVVQDVIDYPDERLAPFVAREGLHTLAGVPLLAKDRVVGALTVGTRRPRTFPLEEMDFLVSIGRQLGVAVDNARLYKETEQKSDRLAALNRISQVVASSLKLDEVYDAFVQVVAGLVPLDRTSIVFFDDNLETYEVAVAFARGQTTLMKGTRLPLEGSGQEPLVTQRRAQLRPNLSEEPPFTERDQLIAQGIRCTLALPLICKDRLIGAVNFASGQPNAYSKVDITLLTNITEQVAVAVENSRLYHLATTRLAEMETLFHFSTTLRLAVGVDKMLPVIIDQAVRAVGADGGLLSLRELDHDRVVVRAAIGSAAGLLGREFPVLSGPSGQTMQTDQPEIIPHMDTHPTIPADVRAHLQPGASGIRLPLRAGMEIIGALHIGFDAPHVFGTGEVRLLSSLADLSASAIHRANLDEQLKYELRACKLAEEAVRQSEANYRDLFESAYDVVCLFDREGNCVDANRRAEMLTGFSRTELFRMNLFQGLVIPEDQPLARKVLQDAIDGKERIYEVRWQAKDGSVIHFEGATTSRFSSSGEFLVTRCTLRDLTERNQRERELEAIAALSAALRTAQTSDDMLPVILDQLLVVLEAAGACFATLDPVSGETLIELGRGRLADSTAVRLPAGEGVIGLVIATRQPYFSNDVQTDTHFYRLDLLGDIPAAVCVPLLVQGESLGALLIVYTSDITPQKTRLLNAIADIAANAIHRATLHEQTELRLQHLTALHAIDMAISSSLDLRITLNVLLDQVTTQLDVDAAEILLLNPGAQTLEYAVGRGFRSAAIQRSHLRLGESYAGRAALERRVISVPNLAKADDLFARARLVEGEDFISHYALPLIAKGQVKGVLSIFHRALLAPNPEWLDFLESLATQAAIAIDNAELFDDLQRSNVELTLAYDTTIEGWSRALDLRDKETEGHTLRVTEMTMQLACTMGVSEMDLKHMRRGALLHDIGKMGIPDSILFKPGSLTDKEWETMRLHPQYAYDLLSSIAFLQPALDIPYCHHEKWDGTGYPRGLKGEKIPLAARIFAVVDVWDALRSDRPYRKAWENHKVREHIEALAGEHFDPRVVESFLEFVGR